MAKFNSRPDLRGTEKETVAEFLSRGGTIKTIKRVDYMKSLSTEGKVMPDMEKRGVCQDCVFYRPGKGNGSTCCYFPPLGGGKGWAKVEPGDSCSRFRRYDRPLAAMEKNDPRD